MIISCIVFGTISSRTMKKHNKYCLGFITLACILSSCQWLPDVAGVKLSDYALTMQLYNTRAITATVEPREADYDEIIWTSSDASVANVSSGKVTALRPGTAQITASTSGVISDPCIVTVSGIPVSSVSFKESTVSLTEGNTYTLRYTIYPSDATDQKVVWKSLNPSIVIVDSYGTVKAVSAGAASIVVTTVEGAKSATCVVMVRPKDVNVTGVSVTPSSLALIEGETATLSATVSPSNATNKSLSWSSSNASVATVSSDGKVKAVGAGSATITVTTSDGGRTAKCSVTVEAAKIPVTGMTLNQPSLSLVVGTTSVLTPQVFPSNATDKTVTWSSSNTTVSTVSSSGVVTAKSAGSATITCTTNDGGKQALCYVTVTRAVVKVTSVSLSSYSLSLTAGESIKLTTTVSPSNATNKSVSWSSSNSAVATVSSDGTVSAKSAGSATITVRTTDGGKTATCRVTVKAATIAVNGVSISPSTMSLNVGESSKLKATVSPANATNTSVSWTSSNSSVATVASDGTVTAKAAGSATITCTTQDGSKKATCTVTVKNSTVSVTGVSLNRTTLSLTAGTSGTLSATVSPSNATNAAVSWTSSNTSVATVSSSGVVTANAAGTAKITVTTLDGNKTAFCTVTVTTATIAVIGVSVSPTTLSLTTGQTSKLTPTVSPGNATNTNVTWTSTNTSIATVSSDGTVTAKAAGSATITCTTQDGSKKVTCAVTVTDPNVTLKFIPQTTMNGVSGFKTNTLVFQPLAVGGIDSSKENWTASGKEVTASDPVVIQYSVTPSSTALDASYGYTLYFKDVSTRTSSSNDFSLMPTFKSYSNGVLSLTVEVSGREAYGNDMSQFALTVRKNTFDCTSDWATLKTDRNRPIISGINSSLSTLWTNQVDRSSCDASVSSTSTIDLKRLIQLQLRNEESGATKSWSLSAMKTAGLGLEYEIVKNYKIGSPAADQAEFATLQDGVLYPRSYSTATTGDRTPIVRVKLLHNDDVIDVAYIKVCISFPSSVAVTGVSLDKTSLSLEEGKNASLTATVSPSNATNKAVTWTSSNTTVATVSSSGVVTAKSAGSATITCTTEDSSKNATCTVTVFGATTGTENGHEWVDLGLSVKWATCNVGASRPEGYGNYYAWGETSTKSNYSWSYYKWCKNSAYTLTKYCKSSGYGQTDGKTQLEESDDVAYSTWKGSWRMPTIAELNELINNCIWSQDSVNGVEGYTIKSKKNGMSIFLPLSGYKSGSSTIGVGTTPSYGYWSVSTEGMGGAFCLYLGSSIKVDTEDRCYGLTVRAVKD